MLRLIIGLIKGAIVGGAIGYGLLRLGWTGSSFAYLSCALVGALVGVVAGRAPWRAETIWTPILKMFFGALIGAGLCALAFHVLPNRTIQLPRLGAAPLLSGALLAPIVGVLYGMFVELDDGSKSSSREGQGKKSAKPSPSSEKVSRKS